MLYLLISIYYTGFLFFSYIYKGKNVRRSLNIWGHNVFLPKNSTGDNLQEISKPVFWEKLEKYHHRLLN